MRNLRKCLDRIFRKIVAKLENKKAAAVTTTVAAVESSNHNSSKLDGDLAASIDDHSDSAAIMNTADAGAIFNEEAHAEKFVKEY